MGVYNPMNNRQPPPPAELHPIWRGFGCLISLIMPIISYAAASIIIDFGIQHNWPIPYQLMGPPAIHPLLWKVTALGPLWAFIQSLNNLYAILALAFLLTIILETITSILYAIMYRSAVPRYRPLDAPPPSNVKIKRYKR